MSPSTSKPILELIPFAYATLSKVAIISLSQQLTLDVWKAPIEEDVNCVTCLAWKTSEKSAIDINSIESKNARLMSRYPALATSWGRQIAVKVLVPIRKQLSFSTRVSVVVKKISEFDLSQIIVSLFWIENKYLVAINRNLDMFVLDPLSSQILEVIGGSESKLMPSLKFKLTVEDKSEFELDKYNTSAASTFSEAVMLIITESDDLLIESFSLRSWEAIVDELILNNQWMKAFMFGISMFESSSTETKDKMHSNYHLQVSDRFLILLLRHIDQVFSSATEAKEYNSSSINELAEVSINFCSKLERVEFLLSEVFPRFKSFSCEKGKILYI